VYIRRGYFEKAYFREAYLEMVQADSIVFSRKLFGGMFPKSVF